MSHPVVWRLCGDGPLTRTGRPHAWAAGPTPGPGTEPGSEAYLVNMSDKTEIQMTEDEWRERLSPERFAVLRQQATEPAFSGEYAFTKDGGMYRCAGCGAE